MNTTMPAEETVRTVLREVIDPEIGCNIVDLGLVYDVACNHGNVEVTMTLTTRGCPMHESICYGVQAALRTLPGVAEVRVRLVWDPPWSPAMMTEAGREMTGIDSY